MQRRTVRQLHKAAAIGMVIITALIALVGIAALSTVLFNYSLGSYLALSEPTYLEMGCFLLLVVEMSFALGAGMSLNITHKGNR